MLEQDRLTSFRLDPSTLVLLDRVYFVLSWTPKLLVDAGRSSHGCAEAAGRYVVRSAS